MMGPVRICHRSHHFATQSSHYVDRAGWQAKMASIEFWMHDVMRTAPILVFLCDKKKNGDGFVWPATFHVSVWPEALVITKESSLVVYTFFLFKVLFSWPYSSWRFFFVDVAEDLVKREVVECETCDWSLSVFELRALAWYEMSGNMSLIWMQPSCLPDFLPNAETNAS